jgi:hypothetical protein
MYILTTNQCTRIAMQRLIEIGWACGVTLALKVALLARNRVISSVSWIFGLQDFSWCRNKGATLPGGPLIFQIVVLPHLWRELGQYP